MPVKNVISHRLAHLDLKGMPPTPHRLVQWLDVIQEAGYTGLLVEWEDCFPWEVDQRFRSPTAYDRQFVEQFHVEAQSRQLQVIPLIQSLGHMEMVLRLPDYAHLREVPDRYDGLKPRSVEAQQLIVSMIDEVLAVMPQPPAYFHIGGDEAWNFGQHPDNHDFLRKNDHAALFIEHYAPLFEALQTRGVRPMIWHDMLRGWSDEKVRQIGQQTDIMAWGYNGHPDQVDSGCPHHYRHLEQLARCGIQLWGATAFKGAGFFSNDVPDKTQRLDNALAWAQVAKRYGMKGVAATGWSRFNTLDPQCYPMEGSLHLMAAVGNILRDGEVAENILEIWMKKLVEAGHENLPTLNHLLGQFEDQRNKSWGNIRRIREQYCGMRKDPRYQGLTVPPSPRIHLQNHLKDLEQIANQIRCLLEENVPSVWIECYLAERLEPLREEMDRILNHYVVV